MTRSQPDTSAAFFEAMYQGAEDPWNFAISQYEQQRYAAMDARLGEQKFALAFEPACSVGVFTQRLGRRCDAVIASDAAPTAVQQARQRCQAMSHVQIDRAELPDEMPTQSFDLIVFAECGYYFPIEQLRLITKHLCDRMSPGGVLLACHSLLEWTDHRLHGATVHELIDAEPRWRIESSPQPTDGRYRLDYWRKN